MKLVTPLRVGLLVIGSAVCLFIFLTFIKKGGLSRAESIAVFALFRDASGIGPKSRVQVAGIPVGEVTSVTLVAGRAKVTLRVRKDVGMREDAAIIKRSESLLGDFVLDLDPGTQNAPPMPDGGEIKRVVDKQAMEAVFSSLEKITGDIQSVTHSLKEVLGGDKGQASMEHIVQNLVGISDNMDHLISDSADRLAVILRNVEGTSATVRRITTDEQAAIRDFITNADAISRDVRDVVSSVKKAVGTEEGELGESATSFKNALARLDRSLANVEEVTERVKRGEGALGTLISDKRIGQKLSETVEDVSTFVSRIINLKLEVGFRSEYLFAQGNAKNYLSLRFIPKPDKYYLLELVDDPRGITRSVTIQQNPPAEGQPAVQQVTTTTADRLKFSAQFAKRYYFTTLRLGIIESSGGFGVDVHFLSDVLTLKLDAFDFSVENIKYPRLRAALRATAFNHVFVTAGMDDILNEQQRDSLTGKLVSGRDFFLGAGLYFTDQDLQALFTVGVTPSLTSR